MRKNNKAVNSNSSITFNQKCFEKALKQIERLASETENDIQGPKREVALLRDCGILQIVLPGNMLDFNGANTKGLLKILKKVGKANLSVGRILEGHVNALYLIHLFGSKQQKNRWFSGIIEKGDLYGTWNTQDQRGTSFLNTPEGFEIKGFKTFCSGAAVVTKALITGHLKHKNQDGWQIAIIKMDNHHKQKIDFDSWKPLGMKASGSYRVDFSGYKFAKEDFLGKIDSYYKQPYFGGGAIRFAAVQLGGAEAIAFGTINYLKTLVRTSDPIQQLRLAKMMSAITAGNLWINQAAQNFDAWAEDNSNQKQLLAFANMTRTAIEELCLLVMELSSQCIGARGLSEPHAFGRIMRDLTFYLRQPAPDATRLAIAEYFINLNNGTKK